MFPLQSYEPLPKSQVLQEQIAARTRVSGNKNKQKSQQAEHGLHLMKEPPCHTMHLPDLAVDRHLARNNYALFSALFMAHFGETRDPSS
jgi:hypothetical protein